MSEAIPRRGPMPLTAKRDLYVQFESALTSKRGTLAVPSVCRASRSASRWRSSARSSSGPDRRRRFHLVHESPPVQIPWADCAQAGLSRVAEDMALIGRRDCHRLAEVRRRRRLVLERSISPSLGQRDRP